MKIKGSYLRLCFYSFIIIYSMIIFYLCCIRYYYGLASAWDLGLMNQIISSASRLEPMYYNVEPWWCGKVPCSFFACHFSLTLYLLVPFYWIYPSVITILFFKLLLLIFSALVLYKYCLERTSDEKFSIMCVMIYLLHPGIIGAMLFDFHPEAFFPLFFFLLIYSIEKKKIITAILSFIALVCSLEYFCIFVPIVVSTYLLFRNKGYKNIKLLALCILIIIIGYILYNIEIEFMKTFRNPVLKSQFLNKDIMDTLKKYDGLINAVVKDIHKKIFYFVFLFLPFMFIPFRKPLLLLPLVPWFFLGFIMNIEPYYMLDIQYSFFVVPVIVIAFIEGWLVLNLHLNKNIIACLFCCILITIIFTSQIIKSRVEFSKISNNLQKIKIVQKYVDFKNNEKVIFPDNIFVLYSGKNNSYTLLSFFVSEIDKLNQEKLEWYDYYISKLNAKYIIVDFSRMQISLRYRFFKIINRTEYKPIVFINDLFIFEKTNNCTIKFFKTKLFYFDSRHIASFCRSIDNDSIINLLECKNNKYSSLIKNLCEAGVKVDLYPGIYKVIFNISTNNVSNIDGNIRIEAYDGNYTAIYPLWNVTTNKIIAYFYVPYYDFYNVCLINSTENFEIHSMQIEYITPYKCGCKW